VEPEESGRLKNPLSCGRYPGLFQGMRILYIGTGGIGLPALQYLLDSPHQICGVICQPDKPAGRKQVMTAPATKVLALSYGVPVFQPRRIRTESAMVRDFRLDLAVVMAYGQILPRPVLDAPRLGCVNLHASLLPRHRGASPIQAAILAGDPESGITVMYMDEGLDTGDILLTEHLALAADETGASLHDRLASLAPHALARALHALESGTAPRTPQDPAAVTHTAKLTRADGIVSWNDSAEEISRRVRAFHSWPGTSTTLPGGAHVKVFPPAEALHVSGGCAPPGTLLAVGDDGIIVACGTGALRIRQVQAEGRNRMDAAAFLAGNPLRPGARLGTRD
jgi:methionyl-tRNA formyltransferase